MTRFEASVIMFSVAAIVFILVIAASAIVTRLNRITRWQESIWQELRRIWVNVADTAEYTHNHIAPDVETLSNNFQYLLDGKKGVPALFDIVDKIHRNLCVEIADKMVDRAYKQPTGANGTPCYAPDNIRKWDCVNCPKRSTCGTWTTNILTKAEDTAFQERFNDNKEE